MMPGTCASLGMCGFWTGPALAGLANNTADRLDFCKFTVKPVYNSQQNPLNGVHV